MGRKIKNTDRWKQDRVVKWNNCFECGSAESIHYHHVVPEVKGGKGTIPLCYICHGKVHDRDFKNYKELQMIGIQKAKAEGKYKGRNHGTIEDPNKFLNKHRNKEIVSMLKKGYSYRKISIELKMSPATVCKVVKYYEQIHGIELIKKKVKVDLRLPNWMFN